MVIVNTVVLVQGLVGKGQADVGLALACFGGGSMATALVLPRVPDEIPDRRVMLLAALPLGGVLLAFAGVLVGVGWFNVRTSTTVASGLVWPALCVVWAMLGLGYSSVLTPTGRLLRRSAQPSDRPAHFAAQFALSHLCWLVTYPLAGWLGAAAGMEVTLGMLGGLTLIGAILNASFWPAHDPEIVEHYHEDLIPNHPHLARRMITDTPTPSSSTTCTLAGPAYKLTQPSCQVVRPPWRFERCAWLRP
jgi:MFS family permease